MEYFYLYVSIIVSVGLSFILISLSRMLVARNINIDKIQGYECGFQPFSSVLVEFDVQFYVVALLFLLFDVELMLLFPWCVIFFAVPTIAFSVFFLFVLILLVGIAYEWIIGGLEFTR